MADLIAAVRSGERLASLEAIRDTLAARLDGCGPRDAAPIAKQLGDVIREIEALRAPEEADGVDEVARRRAERRAEAASREPSALQQ